MKNMIIVFITAILLCMFVLTPMACFADGEKAETTAQDETETTSQDETETTAQDETESAAEISDTTDSETETSVSSSTTYPKKGFETFKNYSLPILLFGMAGIFIVLGLIALCIWLLGKYSNKSNDNKSV